ncbi:MAG: hypothetical protein R6V05_01065 [Candidatus Brocadiia bacterium]
MGEASRRMVRRLADRMPRDLRRLRGQMMLEPVYESLGVEEVTCPACGGSGWLDRRALDYCPICCGFQEVPDRLADWFRGRAAGCRAEDRRIRVHVIHQLTTTAAG